MAIEPPESIRRPAVGRVAAARQAFAPEPPWRMPLWLRRLLIWLLALALLIAALVTCRETRKPTSLDTSTLGGPRLVTGPICIEEAVDVSGSMTAFTAQRERAERALFDFARRELGRDDLFAAAFFAGSGKVAIRPSSLDTLTTAPGIPQGIDPEGTQLAPAVRALVAARGAAAGRCAARALVLITDGLLGDPEAAGEALRAGAYTRVFAVIPAETGWSRPDPLTGPLDAVSIHHFTDSGAKARVASILADAKPLDIVLGQIAGSLTGQHLKQKGQPR